MYLFQTPESNLLPFDGEVFYYDSVFSKEESDNLLKELDEKIDWQHDEIILFGKRILTERKVAWYGENSIQYTYSKVTKTALPWTNDLLFIKNKIEKITKQTYNSCLLNRYQNGNQGMSWHSDDEDMLKKNGSIASVSFGVGRILKFKHKREKSVLNFFLENGSLLDMREDTQLNWLHALPKSKKIQGLRINLTFRQINS
jgi:alkylated DNA repair dioxygenase AlkB